MNQPLVSVLMSVKDGQLYKLMRSINSILNQSFTGFEFLIMDDGSSNKEIKEYLDTLEKKDGRIKLFRQNNKGLTKSLNMLLSEALAPICARIDADDYSLPDRFKKQIKYLNENVNIGIVGCWVRFITDRKKLIREWKLPDSSSYIKSELKKGNPLVHSSIMFRKQLVSALGGYDERIKASQDYELWRRCALHTEFAIIQEILHEQCLSLGTITMTRTAEQRKSNWIIKLAYNNNKGIESAIEKYLENKNIYDHLFENQAESYRATVWAMAGCPFHALFHIFKGLFINPLNYKLWLKCGIIWLYAASFFIKNIKTAK